MNIQERLSENGEKIYFIYDYGRKKGGRVSSGLFIYTKPKNAAEKEHNKTNLELITVKKGQAIIEAQAIGTEYIPKHKFKANFYEYYEEYVTVNTRKGNRHLKNSLTQLKIFHPGDKLSPVDITENFCKRYREFLMAKYTGETPMNYFTRFKEVIHAATKEGYFKIDPTDEVAAKSNPSKKVKDNLEAEDYFKLLDTPCINEEVKEGFIFCLYTGLRWCDLKKFHWVDATSDVMVKRLVQSKTGQPVTLTLHPTAVKIIEKRRKKNRLLGIEPKLVFDLPTADGANILLREWASDAGVQAYLSWSVARLSFSILLQDKNTDDATVAALLGHKTTDQVRKTYKRHRPKNEAETINKLPNDDWRLETDKLISQNATISLESQLSALLEQINPDVLIKVFNEVLLPKFIEAQQSNRLAHKFNSAA